MARPIKLVASNTTGSLSQVYRVRELKILAANLLAASEALLAELEQHAQPAVIGFGGGMRLHDEVRRFEIELIRHALKLTGGHQLRAAKLLGVKATTLSNKIKRYQLCAPDNSVA